jgi:hypothetical protein
MSNSTKIPRKDSFFRLLNAVRSSSISGCNQRISPWKSNVRVCMLVPCRSSLNVNGRSSYVAPHDSFNFPGDGTNPRVTGTYRDSQVKHTNFSSFGRQTKSMLSKRHLSVSRTQSFESGASILKTE